LLNRPAMFYFKLSLIVIAGSIGIWFALQGLVASTAHLPATFTVDTVSVEQRRILEAAKDNPSPNISTRENLTPRTDSETMSVQTQPDDSGEEQVSAAEPLSMVAEQPAEQPAVEGTANALTDITEVKGDRQQTNQQDGESAAERADSDADMQVNNKNGSDIITSQAESVRGKALELDNKLLDTINPIDTTEAIKPDTVRALDIMLAVPPDSTCDTAGDGQSPQVGVHYRLGSYAIKGKSLTNIDLLIQVYDRCGGKLLVIDNIVDTEESDESLIQLRQDEVKYYLLQRRVPKDDIIFSDN